MSLLHCAISGEALEVPVASRRSGHVFEKRVITKHIEATGKCPITGQDLSLDDLIPLQINKTVKPRPPNAAGVPGLLSLLQSEWDAFVLESYTLKQHLEVVRQELSHALYQYDAACRVIARLIRERDEARSQLGQLQQRLAEHGAGLAAKNGEEGRMEDESWLPNDLLNSIDNLAVDLNTMRKQLRKKDNAFADFAGQENIVNFRTSAQVQVQSGVSALDVYRLGDNLLATGGVDGKVALVERNTANVVATYEGTGKRVTEVAFVQREIEDGSRRLLACYEDGRAEHLRFSGGKLELGHRFEHHKASITGGDIHPNTSLAALVSADKTWSFLDLDRNIVLHQGEPGGEGLGLQLVKFHPDGQLLAHGSTEGVVRLWSIMDKSLQAEITTLKGPTRAIAFSESGYHLAVAGADDKTVQLWDLRHTKLMQTLLEGSNFSVHDLSFDPSGRYLAVAGSSIALFNVKTFEELAKINSHSADVTRLRWGPKAQYLASSSLDQHLHIYS